MSMNRSDHSHTIRELELVLEQKSTCPLPKLWGAVYAAPNHDGSRKSCKNCTFWVTSRRCVLHDPALDVAEDAVCGYHIEGAPQKEVENRTDLVRLDPKLSGLEQVGGGTSCDICKFYTSTGDDSGTCGALFGDDDRPAVVQPKGCCARWEQKQ